MTVEEWKRKNPPIRRKPITNADYIRAISDEELAKELAWLEDINYDQSRVSEWLEWLKEEYKNEH